MADKNPRRESLLATGYNAIRRGSLGVAAQFVSELKGFEQLKSVNSLRIELADQESMKNAIHRFIFRGESDFDPISFRITTDSDEKTVLYQPELRPKHGFVLMDLNTQDLLSVTLSEKGGSNSQERTVGKILHPLGMTFYKIRKTDTAQYIVKKAIKEEPGVAFTVGERNSCWLTVLRFFGMTFDNKTYVIKKHDKILGTVVPKTGREFNVFCVQFESDCADTQIRAAICAFGMYLTLEVAYPIIFNILHEGLGGDMK